MSTPLARFQASRATGRITWRSVLGILLVPLVVAGVLVWAFWNPQERLDTVNAAIVNLDEPVELDGQTVPLGRQLAAGLVGGGTSDSASTSASAAGADLSDTNYNWVLTDEEDATDGLDSGRFTAVVTIPENFSAAATSFSGDAADAEKATIEVNTSDKSRLVDDAISTVITSTAASLVGNQLTTTYLENIYVGFNTLGEQLGTAADGAQELATGANTLADGASQLASGTTEFSGGVSTFASGVTEYTRGVTQLSTGLTTLQQQTAALPAQTRQLADGAAGLAAGVQTLADSVTTQGALLGRVAEECAINPLSATYCVEILTWAAEAQKAAAQNPNGTQQLVDGANGLASGASQLAGGLPALTSGIGTIASGASQLSTSGATLSSGAQELATGAADLATGTTGISEGVTGVAGGVDGLASGLGEATDALPSYTESERETLADVVATPVVAEGSGTGLSFGTTGVPFFAALALWLGAFASFLVLRARPLRALGSTRPSTVLAFKAWLPGALVGIVQGVMVAAVLQPLMKLDTGDWFAFAGVSALAAIAFASTNQALNAFFGGAGRFVSMVVALVLIGTSIIATAPAALDTAVGVTPLQPALDGFRAIVTSGGGIAAAVAGLIFWTLGAFVVTCLAVVRSRTVTARQLVPRLA
ncbi:putative membrane protein [Okibacterium sp. HSC-33S16]|uniref:ABC transporter permease n=1 Tax=Okibacterium sp. HSC-33S16 TaxID=2910965 RepID=UPI0020A21D3A|nr:ABC transporter permease [Okibacterium sp. HSC-33S16]MCP2031458.1 putative membrane protein [Okibacterium sp. HSC-33S16]